MFRKLRKVWDIEKSANFSTSIEVGPIAARCHVGLLEHSWRVIRQSLYRLEYEVCKLYDS
jgi:hypothetical protein